MGKEIVYCEICGDRILEQEFSQGKALTVLNKNYCFNCKDEAVKNITMEDVADEEAQPDPPSASGTTRTASRHGSSRRRRAVATPTAPPLLVQESSSKLPVIVGASIGAVAIIVLLIILLADNGKSDSSNEPSNGEPGAPKVDKAEKAWNQLQSIKKNADANEDYDSVLNTIQRLQGDLKGSRWEDAVVRMKSEYQQRKRDRKSLQEAKDLLVRAEQAAKGDPKYLRFPEILEMFHEAYRIVPRSDTTSDAAASERAFIAKARKDYEDGYEEGARKIYDQWIQQIQGHMNDGEHGNALKIIDAYFPEALRHSRIWKGTLKGIYDKCKKKTERKVDEGGDGRDG